ncbi:MAG TPA: hypothetical protein VK867_08575, partial [Candidatus Limnocylindrales bacterium]|nr:hypothetical protein [Candidatus Limnocylindrales bacterium]
MNFDDRLDRDVRNALEWRAEHRARRAPNLTESSSVVAMRIAPGGRRIEPVVVGRPTSNRSLQFLVVALLLLGVAIAAWVVGAPQLRQSVPFQPVPFGFAGPCDEPADESIVYSVYADETPTTLFRDGLLLTSLQRADGTRIDFFGTQDTLQRRLNDRGIRLVEERIAASDISGCRYLRASVTSGEIRLSTPDGPAALFWHPANGAGQFLRSMTPQEERAATELMTSLRSPEAWLPDDAWTDSVERRLTPDQWYVLVDVSPSGYGPGDRVTLSTGEVLNGSDPRYELVVLPGGQEPATFGALLPAAAGQPRTRCGVVSTAEARALAESLDSIPLAMDDVEELFTTDLRTKVFVYIASAAPHPPDCARLVTERQRMAAAPPTTPLATPGPADDFAWVDPCNLLPPSAEELIPGATDRRKGPAALA